MYIATYILCSGIYVHSYVHTVFRYIRTYCVQVYTYIATYILCSGIYVHSYVHTVFRYICT